MQQPSAIFDWLGRRRSKYRFNGVRYNLEKWILPFFGDETLVSQITPQRVEEFLEFHKSTPHERVNREGKVVGTYTISLMTLWHYVKDFNALMNWCVRERMIHENPVKTADRSELRFRERQKLPMNPEWIERGAEALKGVHRAYYDFLRFTGARRGEGNALEWEHLDLDRGLFLMPGSKTPKARAVRPLPAQVVKQLLELPRTGKFVFPSAAGVEAFDRRKMFSKVSRHVTAVYHRPIKITAKDLRDWFGTQVVQRTSDPRKIMELMRHTNLKTTTRYMRSIEDELRGIVDSLGENHN